LLKHCMSPAQIAEAQRLAKDYVSAQQRQSSQTDRPQ